MHPLFAKLRTVARTRGDHSPRANAMRHIRILLLPLFVLSLASACHRSGIWVDDAKNWKRAFGQSQPRDIEIVRSWYWRSPHFTHEFEYFFALAPNDAFRKQAEESGNLIHFTEPTKEERQEVQRFFHEKPAWFIPKPLETYEIWKSKEPHANFRLFIDRQTGELFLTDFTV